MDRPQSEQHSPANRLRILSKRISSQQSRITRQIRRISNRRSSSSHTTNSPQQRPKRPLRIRTRSSTPVLTLIRQHKIRTRLLTRLLTGRLRLTWHRKTRRRFRLHVRDGRVSTINEVFAVLTVQPKRIRCTLRRRRPSRIIDQRLNIIPSNATVLTGPTATTATRRVTATLSHNKPPAQKQ